MAFERHKMNKRVVQDLKKRSTIGILFYIVLSFIIVFADNSHERHLIFSMFFLLSMGGICLFRLVHLVVSSKMGENYETLNKNIFLQASLSLA
jgi:Mn2+/Fe2+ NRAMP family transporter